MTLRTLLNQKNIEYKKQNISPLDEWFDEILPYALTILSSDPLAGDSYDGQLISSLATLNKSDIEKCSFDFSEISEILNKIDKSSLSRELLNDIQKINGFS